MDKPKLRITPEEILFIQQSFPSERDAVHLFLSDGWSEDELEKCYSKELIEEVKRDMKLGKFDFNKSDNPYEKEMQ